MGLRAVGAIAVLMLTMAPARSAEAQTGRFLGPIQVDFISDREDRGMSLLGPVVYIDSAGRRWEAPEGAHINGASIPQPLWSVIGSPFTGSYRAASIIHDYYCDVRLRPWREVHRMFYDAMLSSGVEPLKAKLMYVAVLYAGPRWDDQAIYNTRMAATRRGGGADPVFTAADPVLNEAAMEALRQEGVRHAAAMPAAERRALQDPDPSPEEMARLQKLVEAGPLSLEDLERLAAEARLKADLR
jgi:hypothetical protein